MRAGPNGSSTLRWRCSDTVRQWNRYFPRQSVAASLFVEVIRCLEGPRCENNIKSQTKDISPMKRRTTVVLLALAVAFGGLFAGLTMAAEKKSKVVEAKAQKSRGEGKDENIKSDAEPKNPTTGGPPAPPDKGGDKSRGAYCQIHVDNHTPLWIKIYVDGYYAGTMPPWGDLYPTAISGGTQLYGRADFVDGTWRFWGPYHFDCDEVYTWRLSP